MTTPWEMRRRELTEEHGDWADFAAWREWFKAKLAHDMRTSDTLDVLDDLPATTETTLYSYFADAVHEAQAQKALEV